MTKETIATDLDADWTIKMFNCRKNQIYKDLPKNFDSYVLTVMQEDYTFDISSDKIYYAYIKKCAEQYKEKASLLNKGKVPAFKDIDVYDMLVEYDIVKLLVTPISTEKGSQNKISYWIKDYNDTTRLYKPVEIKQIINIINDVFRISNFNSLLTNVETKLRTIVPEYNSLTKLNLAPSHIILFKNGVFNAKTFKFSTDVTAFGEYDFISKINHKLLAPSQVEQSHLALIRKLLSEWVDGDEEKVTLLKQVPIAVIDGNGRDTYIIIIGAGGNGKSIYLNMLTKLASGYDANLDMQDIGDDNKINNISESTKLILGHELATNAKFTGNMISRIKQLATGDPIKVNVKFKDAKVIATDCVKIQATNTVPKIFENNNAILRRIKLVQWTDKDFSKLETNIDLDSLIDDPDFIEAFISYIFCGTGQFKKFINIKSVEEDSAEAVNDADQVYQFLNHLKEQEQLVGEIPTNVLYKMYDYWNKLENPGSRPLKSKEFLARVKTQCSKFGITYDKTQKRLSARSGDKFNFHVLNKYYYNYKLDVNKYSNASAIICEDQVTDDDILNIQMKLGLDELDFNVTYKRLLIIDYLIANKLDNDAIAYKEILDGM